MKFFILLPFFISVATAQVDFNLGAAGSMGGMLGGPQGNNMMGNPGQFESMPMGMPGAMGGMNGFKRNLDLSFLKNQGQCAFEPQLSADDQTLLTNAERAMKLLRENDKCSVLSTQFNAFQTAMQSYNQQTGGDRTAGFDGSVAVNCTNYDQIYDLEYDYFVNTWDSASTDMMDPYASCRGQAQTEAMTCAAKVTGITKALKKKECIKFETSINKQSRALFVAETYKTGLQAMQAILNNEQCLDATGSQKLSFIQTAVGLAGRAATIGSAGGPAGLLIGAATDIVSSVFNKLFTANQKSKDNLSILENRNNFTKLACLYEKLEDKALRCDRLTASQEVDGSKKAFDEAEACVLNTHKDVLNGNNIVKDLSDLVQAMNKPAEKDKPASPALNQEAFDNIVQKLQTPYPGTTEPTLNLAEKASGDVVKALEEAMASDDSLKGYLKKTGNTSSSGSQLRQAKTKIEKDLARAKDVNGVLKSIKDADAKGTQMSGADLENVVKSFKAFEGKAGNFASEYNTVLSVKANLDPTEDIGARIKNFNLKINEAGMYQEVVNRVNTQRRVASSEFQDNGNFNEARSAMRPHLRKLLNQELDTLYKRTESLKDIQPGAPSTVMKEQMQTKEEEVIYPLLRACNQLRSVMNYDGGDLNTSSQHDACKAFSCSQGSKSFQDYLAEKKISGPDIKTCQSTNCQGYYSRYVCQERMKLPAIRNNLKNEFLSKGTLCGRPISQAFNQ